MTILYTLFVLELITQIFNHLSLSFGKFGKEYNIKANQKTVLLLWL